MNRLLVFIIAFSISLGLAVGWRLPYLWERQAFDELSRQCSIGLSKQGLFQDQLQSTNLAEDCVDWSLKLVLARYLSNYRNHVRTLDLIHLSEAAGIQAKYDRCLTSVSLSLYRGQYRLAAEYAKTALSLRPLRAEPKSPWRTKGKYQWDELYSLNSEEYFAENLCSLGMYEEAKSLILSFPEIPTVPKSFCIGPFLGYRRGVLAEACLGLKEYDEVTRELSKPIPDLVESNSTWAMLEFLQGFAYLAQRKNVLAKEAISKWANRCPVPSELERLLFRIPETGNDFNACNLSKAIIEFFELHQPDSTTPQNLDYCGAAMEAYGHTSAAELLFSKAQQIRQQ